MSEGSTYPIASLVVALVVVVRCLVVLLIGCIPALIALRCILIGLKQ